MTAQPRWISVPARLLFILLVLAPVFCLVWGCFWREGEFSLPPLEELILSARQLRLLGASLLLAAITTGFCLVLALPYGLLIERTDVPGRTVFRSLSLLPLLIPPYVQAAVWEPALGKAGTLSRCWSSLFGVEWSIPPILAAAGVLAFAYYPVVLLLVLSGLRCVDKSAEEAALLLGSPWKTMRSVTVPLITPHIISGSVFVMIFSMLDFGVPDIFRLRVYPVEVFVQFSGLYDERSAIVLSLPFLLVTACLVYFQAKVMKGRKYVSFSMDGAGESRKPLIHVRRSAAAFPTVLLALSVGFPLGCLALKTGRLATFWDALASSLPEIVYTFKLAAAAGFLATTMAFFLSHFIERSDGVKKSLWQYLSQLPFAAPGILLGIGLIKVWNRPGTSWLYTSSLIVVVGWVAYCTPFCVRVMLSSFQQVPRQAEEAAHVAGSGWSAIFVRILFPLSRRGLTAAFLLAFVLSAGNLGVALLVIPPGTGTLPIKIYNYMHYGAAADVAALCLVLLVLEGVCALFACLGLNSKWALKAAQ